MKLHRLQLTNFRLHANTAIDFDGGLTGIIGPNGSGKTTILEAIAWSLYGMPAVRGKRQDVRTIGATGRAGVRAELEFDLAGHRHRVVRTLSTAELYIDGASSPIANSTSGVTDLLRRRLGMSQQEFFHTYFTGQKELGAMAAMGPAERAQFLSRVLGYEKLRTAQSLARERRNVLRGELTGIEAAMPESEAVARRLNESETVLRRAEESAQTALARLQKAHESLSAIDPRWKEAQHEREALQQIVAELRVRESEESAVARDLERLERELEDIVAARREIEEIKAELNVHADVAAQLHEMERLFQEEGRRKELKRNHQALEMELAALRERRAKDQPSADIVAVAESDRERLRAELVQVTAQLESARTEWVRDKQEALTKREAARAQYLEMKQQRDQLANLGPDSPCPICTRPLADHFREVLDELDGKLTEIEVNGKYYRNRVEQLEEMPAPVRDLESRVTALEEQVERRSRAVTTAQLRVQELGQLARDIGEREARLGSIVAQLTAIPSGYHETRHAQLRQQHAQLAPLAERSVRLGTLAEREPRVRKEVARVRKDLERARQKIENLRKQRAESKFSEQAFARLQKKHEGASTELRASELAALAAEKELEAARVARSAALESREELERAQERLRSLTTERRLHDEIDLAFTDIRSDLNQHLRPELSEIASGFLSELTDGRYTDLELDEDYSVVVKEDDIPKPVISGGEEDIANLVLRLAISQMIADRAGQSFSLLILDEIFGSLDETRRHNVVELLRRLHDRFEQVILITHIESVREGLDRVVTVRYDEESQTSRVEQETVTVTTADALLSADEYVEVVGGGGGKAG